MCFCSTVQRCCRQRHAASRLQVSTAPDVDIESDVDNNSDTNASVHLYMPIEQDAVEGIDSVANDTWHSVTLEPYHHLSLVEGPSYTQLQYVPPHTHSQSWHVFNDTSDSSGTDEPLVEFGHIFVPVQSAASLDVERPSNLLASACSGDNCLYVGGIESGDSSRQNND